MLIRENGRRWKREAVGNGGRRVLSADASPTARAQICVAGMNGHASYPPAACCSVAWRATGTTLSSLWSNSSSGPTWYVAVAVQYQARLGLRRCKHANRTSFSPCHAALRSVRSRFVLRRSGFIEAVLVQQCPSTPAFARGTAAPVPRACLPNHGLQVSRGSGCGGVHQDRAGPTCD